MTTIFGTLDNDTLIGTSENDFISGNLGNDNILGIGGDDQLNGNAVNDTVNGGVGNDLVRGGKDNDLLFGDIGNDSLYGDLGNDTARGGDGDDWLYGDSGIESNFSGDGDDFLFGESGNDTLFGLDGNDSLLGDTGADVINGNQGNDTVYGGDGNDLLRGGIDNDRIFGELGDDSLFGDLGNDTVTGAEGKDVISGGRGEDLLSGNGDDDEINGNQGNDTINGDDGNDTLRGGRDNDLISGAGGNDVLYGDRGIDTLTGGDGSDLFFLRKGIGGGTLAEADIITDFVNNADKFGLIDGLTFANLNIFQGSDANAADTIVQDTLNGQFLAVLKSVSSTAIDATDFIVPGTLAFSDSTFKVNEDGTPVQAVTINRTDGTYGAISVKVTASNGSATIPADFNDTPVVVNFAAGETSKTVTIPVVNDTLPEYTETANLTLSDATGGATLGTQATAVLEIVDDDAVSVAKFTLQSPTQDIFSGFGSSLAADGNNLLVGAPYYQTAPSTPAGAAFLFDASTGTLRQSFINPTPSPYENFGGSVAIEGNKVLLSASSDIIDGQYTGAAYLFDATTGVQLGRFLNPTQNLYGGFGNSVKIANNQLFISAPYSSPNGVVYSFDGSNGALRQTFSKPNPNPNSYTSFGSVLAVADNKVLIGSPYEQAGGFFGFGAAYLFDTTNGALLQTFLNPNPNGDDRFGAAVAIANNDVFIGTPYDDINGTDTGAAYLFDATTGALVQTFLNPNPNDYDKFGAAVAIAGNQILIGTPGNDSGATDSGAAYLFDRTTGALLETYLNPTPADYDRFGSSVAIVGDNIAIGELIGFSNPGHVYLF